MAHLFDRDIKTISKHIINVFAEELNRKSDSQKLRIADPEKYVLDKKC